MSASSPAGIPLRERWAADVFEKSYREFQAIRDTDYRWRMVAPESVGYLEQAVSRKWSLEKLSDYLHSTPAEAGQALERFIVSQAVNSQENTPDRIRVGFEQWLRRFPELGEGERRAAALELAGLVSNQLYQAQTAGESLGEVSLGLEKLGNVGTTAKPDGPKSGTPKEDSRSEPPRWGPQWKD